MLKLKTEKHQVISPLIFNIQSSSLGASVLISCSWLTWGWQEPNVVFCYCGLFTSRFDLLCVSQKTDWRECICRITCALMKCKGRNKNMRQRQNPNNSPRSVNQSGKQNGKEQTEVKSTKQVQVDVRGKQLYRRQNRIISNPRAKRVKHKTAHLHRTRLGTRDWQECCSAIALQGSHVSVSP